MNYTIQEKTQYIKDFNCLPPYFPTREIDKIVIKTESGTLHTYIGAAELCMAHDIKTKNLWRIFAHHKGLEVISIETVVITSNLDRKKMIKKLRITFGKTNNELVYLKDDELYQLWKKLTFKN
jgi:hypothetical protein